jgi:hypothetical protein
VEGARGVIINITGGHDLGIGEVNDASQIIFKAAHEEANIIFGAVVDPSLQDRVKITVIATGFGDRPAKSTRPNADTPVAIENYQTWYEEHRQAAPAARRSADCRGRRCRRERRHHAVRRPGVPAPPAGLRVGAWLPAGPIRGRVVDYEDPRHTRASALQPQFHTGVVEALPRQTAGASGAGDRPSGTKR